MILSRPSLVDRVQLFGACPYPWSMVSFFHFRVYDDSRSEVNLRRRLRGLADSGHAQEETVAQPWTDAKAGRCGYRPAGYAFGMPHSGMVGYVLMALEVGVTLEGMRDGPSLVDSGNIRGRDRQPWPNKS